MVLTGLLFYGCLTLFPKSGERFKQAGKDLHSMDNQVKNPKSTAERIVIWKSCLEIIREHALFGAGTGDVKSYNFFQILNG